MTQLAASVDANDELWTLDSLPTTPFVQVQSELVEVRAMFPEHVYLPTNETIPPKIRVRRAQGGTSPASHANGTALTAVYSESAGGGGGGAIAVTDGTTTVPDVTTLEVAGATVVSGGAGVAQVTVGDEYRVRILEASFAFDDPGVVLNDYFDIGFPELSPGTWVDDVWPQLLTTFVRVGGTLSGTHLYFSFASDDASAIVVDLPQTGYDLLDITMKEGTGEGTFANLTLLHNLADVSDPDPEIQARRGSGVMNEAFAAQAARSLPARVQHAVTPKVYINTDATGFSAGEVRLIIRIAEPA